MNGNYDDILSRVPTAPLWYDEYGVPRYEPFTPRRTRNIYCNEAVLVEVVCQACLRTFTVCCSFNRPVFPSMEDHSQADLIRHNYEFLYGDPPRHSEGTYLHKNAKITCVAGDSMNTMAVRVVEYWKRDRWEWVRDPSLEVTIESDERDRIEKGQWQAPPISVPSDTPQAPQRRSFRPHGSGRNLLGTLARWITRS